MHHGLGVQVDGSQYLLNTTVCVIDRLFLKDLQANIPVKRIHLSRQ